MDAMEALKMAHKSHDGCLEQEPARPTTKEELDSSSTRDEWWYVITGSTGNVVDRLEREWASQVGWERSVRRAEAAYEVDKSSMNLEWLRNAKKGLASCQYRVREAKRILFSELSRQVEKGELEEPRGRWRDA